MVAITCGLLSGTCSAITSAVLSLPGHIVGKVFNELFFGGQGCFRAVCIPIVKDLL